MGDRGNVVVLESDGKKVHGTVFLYSHWGGGSLPSIVRRALARRQRWEDSFYLSRIVFCEMLRGQEDGETGFGISTVMGDNSHPLVVLNPATQTIGFYDVAEDDDVTPKSLLACCKTSFADYLSLKSTDAERLGWDDEVFDGWDKQQTVDTVSGE